MLTPPPKLNCNILATTYKEIFSALYVHRPLSRFSSRPGCIPQPPAFVKLSLKGRGRRARLASQISLLLLLLHTGADTYSHRNMKFCHDNKPPMLSEIELDCEESRIILSLQPNLTYKLNRCVALRLHASRQQQQQVQYTPKARRHLSA